MNLTVKMLRRVHTHALSLTPTLAALATTLAALTAAFSLAAGNVHAADVRLEGRAVLPAATFADGPVSGQHIGAGPFNGITVPFAKQPVQGFSAVLKNTDGTFSVMPDNGYGSLENSADFLLRVYRIKPDFETASGGSGRIAVQSFIQLRDPDHRIPFAIVNHFSSERLLTGADFDIESMQRAPDGSLWFGDEFGPFLLHTDGTGRLLEKPIPLPDFAHPGQEVRSPQSPYSEESSALRIMNAVHSHAVKYGNTKTPVFSPYHVMLDDGNSASDHYARGPVSPVGSGLAPAASDIFNVAAMQAAGYPVVCWTVNTTERMTELMKLKLNGEISDRPDLLLAAVRAFDANNDGVPGDFIGADGLIDITKFDAQAHRGGRNLRPENTLPSMEVGLDNLMTTLETDIAITKDFMPVLDHDPHVQAVKVRRADGTPYTTDIEKLVKDLTFAELQHQYIADKIIRDPAFQKNDPSLSPVTLAFKAMGGIPHEYAMPSLQQLFTFVQFYRWYYQAGPGVGTPDAVLKWKNAAKVRFNIETKINPRAEFVNRTFAPWVFTLLVGGTISLNGMQDRADIQSFDFRTLLLAQRWFPQIRTVYLFGDFPIYADRSNSDSDDSTNLQDENGANTPWLAGLFWPYRVTALSNPFRAKRSGGFEGMAITPDGKKLLPLLEKPLVGDDAKTLLMHEFDLGSHTYTGKHYRYRLETGGTSIGDFILFDDSHGLVIERDDSQGKLDGFKRIFSVGLGAPGDYVTKTQAVDLMNITDPAGISLPARPGDIGLGAAFAFPFVTIEDVVVLDATHIGVLNDNNFPFSAGRNPVTPTSAGRADDNEFIILALPAPLWTKTPKPKPFPFPWGNG